VVGRWDLLPALNGDVSRDPFFRVQKGSFQICSAQLALAIFAFEAWREPNFSGERRRGFVSSLND